MRISNSRKVAQELQFASAMEIDGELQRNVNMFLRLKDARLRAAYDDFNCHNQSLSSVFMLNLFILLFSATFFGLVVADHSDSYDLTTEINWSITIVYLLLINIISWVAYIIQRITMYRNHGNLPLASRKVLQYAQMTAYFALNIFVCYRHISREVNGPCKEDHNVPNNWNCNVLGHAQAITLETSIIIMMVPIMYSISVRGAYFEFAIGLWTMTLATLIFSVCYGDERNSILFVAYYMIGSVTILIESRRQNYYLFFTHQKLQSFLVERDRAADAANAQEMRHMIANVAHDLKTPLSSFMSGVEVMAQLAAEITEAQAGYFAKTSGPTTPTHATTLSILNLVMNNLREWSRSLTDCMNNMRNTNTFMLMTINRSIDYTKASKGVKLVPRHETINLMETLALPLKCMQDIQQRIPLVMNPLSTDICSHIITDKQWLQENLLCLLSNAVKYSSEGEVTINCRKVTEKVHHRMVQERAAGGVPSSLIVHNDSKDADGAGAENGISLNNLSSGSLLSERSFSQDYLRIEVEDHGIGLSDEAMATLFSPFKQAQRLAGGTGLGLFSLAKRIEALDGLCGVQRRRDGVEGSLFWFQIPYRPDPTAHLVIASHNSTRSGGDVSTGPSSPSNSKSMIGSLDTIVEVPELEITPRTIPSLSATSIAEEEKRSTTFDFAGTSLSPPTQPSALEILLVDDAPTIIRMTSMILKKHGHRVTVACNGAEAIKLVCDRMQRVNKAFDVVLMDLQMPVMDGLEATRRLRSMEAAGRWTSRSLSSDEHDRLPSVQNEHSMNLPPNAETDSFRGKFIPQAPNHDLTCRHVIIGVSANSDVDTMNEAYRAGVDSFIGKPFVLNTFYQVYDEILKANLMATDI